MENNFIQKAASAGHAVGYTIGSIFKHIIGCVQLYFTNGFTNTYIHTYIIGNYNPSVIIIDLVSHTTYVVCVNIIHMWRDLQFKVDSEREIF